MIKNVKFQFAILFSLISTACLCFITIPILFAQTQIEGKKREGLIYKQQIQTTGYPIGKFLKETELYKLYGWQTLTNIDFHPLPHQWCDERYRDASVSIVFKTDEKFIIDNNENYWKRFENEMLPEIISQCPAADKVIISNYVDGVRINYSFKRLKSKVDLFPSAGLSIAVYSPNSQDGNKYQWFYGQGSIQDLEEIRSSKRINRKPRIDREPGEVSDVGDRTITSISRLRELWAAKIATFEAEEKRKAEEEKREAELALMKKKEDYRAKAFQVLKLYKKGAALNYNFSGYARQQALQNIYSGNFEPFTGGYESNVGLKIQQDYINVLMSRVPLEDSLKEISRITAEGKKIAGLRVPIMIAYFAYHEAFERQCYPANRELNWIKYSYRFDTIKSLQGRVIDQIPGQTYVFHIREPFSNTFDKTVNASHDKLYVQIMTGVSASTREEFRTDFLKFLKTESCSSPKVRHFEINLYLATEWLLPLQELLLPDALGSQTPQVEKQKAESEVQKTKPAVKKTTVKTRKKN